MLAVDMFPEADWSSHSDMYSVGSSSVSDSLERGVRDVTGSLGTGGIGNPFISMIQYNSVIYTI